MPSDEVESLFMTLNDVVEDLPSRSKLDGQRTDLESTCKNQDRKIVRLGFGTKLVFGDRYTWLGQKRGR